MPVGTIKIQSFSTNAANYTFKWVDAATGAVIGSGTAISDLPGGIYQLFATDLNDCESKIFTATLTVTPKPAFDYSSMAITNDQCNYKEGAIASLKVNGLVSQTTYAWFNENGA